MYLGAWIDSTWQDVRVRKAQAWAALNKMEAIWKSKLGRKTKISLFSATVVSVLLYGCETWTLNKQMNKSLDGCYTRMLRKVLGTGQTVDKNILRKAYEIFLHALLGKYTIRQQNL